MTPEAVAARLAFSRQGFTLVGYEEVLIPAFLLVLDAVGQRKKPLPAIEEYVLYAVDQGLGTPEHIAGLLGLQQPLVDRAVVTHWSMDNVDYAAGESGSRRLVLTERGRAAMRELHAVVPEAIEPSFAFDRLLWEVAPQHQLQLARRRDFAYRRELPPRRRRRPEASELDPAKLNALLVGQRLRLRRGEPAEEVEILAVREVGRADKKVVPAVLLVYSAKRTRDALYSIVIDGRESREHTVAFSDVGLEDSLGLARMAQPQGTPPSLPQAVREVLAPEAETDPLYERITAIQHQMEASTDESDDEFGVELRDALERELAELHAKLDGMSARHVPVWLLADLADAALDANRRLLIRGAVANGVTADLAFLDSLEKLLHRGVEVFLGLPREWAVGGDDQVRLNRRLARLATDWRNLIVGFADGQPNILAWDGRWAVSEFPWLGHRGMSGLRSDSAVLVTVREAVDQAFAAGVNEVSGLQLNA